MSEGAIEQAKDIPKTITSSPILAFGIGILFLVIVLIIESFKPGLITAPIRRGLAAVGVGSK